MTIIQTRRSASESRPHYVLLVEDNETNQLVLTHKLNKYGCQVDCAGNGFEALEKVADNQFDLVVMDVSMPEMDGLEATKRIRNSTGPVSRLPVIGLSAHNHLEVRQEALLAGMDDFLSKPISDQDLFAKLDEWLHVRK